MRCLIDTCVWIDFFANKAHLDALSVMLSENRVMTNEIILAEIIPSAWARHEKYLIECLEGLEIAPLNIDWYQIRQTQYQCLRAGMNKIGLLDIAIAQNAMQQNLIVFSTDKHMKALSGIMGFELKGAQ